MRANRKSHFETPTALTHDASALVEGARGLLKATAEIADEKVAAARKRLGDELEASREVYENLQDRVMKGVKIIDKSVHNHPYEVIAAALGAAVLVSLLLSRRG
jgi:ElaB/YqjD/DUF883 family membrane-anchored ribosome-binding protein